MFNEINIKTDLKHYPFPSIGQFSEVIYNVNHKTYYTGQDENNNPVYDKSIILPKIKFTGTVKCHGTNGGIIIDFANEIIYFQARNDVRTPVVDNAGFATYMSSVQENIVDMVKSNIDINSFDWSKNVFAIYGEWCGGNIQGGIALNKLEKMFVIFAVAIVDIETKKKTWFSKEEVCRYKLNGKKVFNIYDFTTYEIEIDFSKHHETTNKLIEMTLAVEDYCPVGKNFGVEGIGEGIVFIPDEGKYRDSGFWFKSKGDKHSKSKVKVIKPVDNEKIAKLIDIADKVTPSWRLEQIFNETFDTINGGKILRTKIGDYIKAVNKDIAKEETKTLVEAGVDFKDVAKYISKIVTDYFSMMEKEC